MNYNTRYTTKSGTSEIPSDQKLVETMEELSNQLYYKDSTLRTAKKLFRENAGIQTLTRRQVSHACMYIAGLQEDQVRTKDLVVDRLRRVGNGWNQVRYNGGNGNRGRKLDNPVRRGMVKAVKILGNEGVEIPKSYGLSKYNDLVIRTLKDELNITEFVVDEHRGLVDKVEKQGTWWNGNHPLGVNTALMHHTLTQNTEEYYEDVSDVYQFLADLFAVSHNTVKQNYRRLQDFLEETPSIEHDTKPEQD